jgi:hypothetical protein
VVSVVDLDRAAKAKGLTPNSVRQAPIFGFRVVLIAFFVVPIYHRSIKILTCLWSYMLELWLSGGYKHASWCGGPQQYL